MTIDEYIAARKCKPLTPKELSRGKNYLRIFGTKDPMPWNTIFTRLAAGQSMEDIAKMYGHGRKIALWAKEENVQVDPTLNTAVAEEIEHRKRMTTIANDDPATATTIMEMVNEIAPDFTQKVAMFASKVVDVATKKLEDKFLEASDMQALTKAVQTATDTTGHTARHAASANITASNIQVEGFSFVLDAPPPKDDTPIEAEAIDAETTEATTDG
jgi:hypothetical protein